MALKATVYKADLQISDMNRNHYQEYPLTLAKHPSETEERLMARLVAFALHADESLNFTKGICRDDEPELWQKSLSGEIELWIELGQIEERRIQKACGKAKQVVVYTYQPRQADVWWQQNKEKWKRYSNLTFYRLDAESGEGDALSKLADRNMQLQCTIQDEDIWLTDDHSTNLHIRVSPW